LPEVARTRNEVERLAHRARPPRARHAWAV